MDGRRRAGCQVAECIGEPWHERGAHRERGGRRVQRRADQHPLRAADHPHGGPDGGDRVADGAGLRDERIPLHRAHGTVAAQLAVQGAHHLRTALLGLEPPRNAKARQVRVRCSQTASIGGRQDQRRQRGHGTRGCNAHRDVTAGSHAATLAQRAHRRSSVLARRLADRRGIAHHDRHDRMIIGTDA